MTIPPQLISILPTLLQMGIDTAFRILELRGKQYNPDMDWDEFVRLVREIDVRDVDELIAEGQGGK